MFPEKAGELPDLEDLVQEFNDDDLADLLPGVVSFRDLLKRFLTDPGFPKTRDNLDEGPDKGVTPYVYINCFIMNDPGKKYSFHLSNSFRDVEYHSHIFIDLEKVDIDGRNGTRPS